MNIYKMSSSFWLLSVFLLTSCISSQNANVDGCYRAKCTEIDTGLWSYSYENIFGDNGDLYKTEKIWEMKHTDWVFVKYEYAEGGHFIHLHLKDADLSNTPKSVPLATFGYPLSYYSVNTGENIYVHVIIADNKVFLAVSEESSNFEPVVVLSISTCNNQIRMAELPEWKIAFDKYREQEYLTRDNLGIETNFSENYNTMYSILEGDLKGGPKGVGYERHQLKLQRV